MTTKRKLIEKGKPKAIETTKKKRQQVDGGSGGGGYTTKNRATTLRNAKPKLISTAKGKAKITPLKKKKK